MTDCHSGPKITFSDNGGPIDWTDPCARAAALSSAYYAALAGSREIEIRTRSFDADELVRFLPVDIEKLRIEMQSAQSECAKARGHRDPNRRFAITAGNRSDIPWYNRNWRRPI